MSVDLVTSLLVMHTPARNGLPGTSRAMSGFALGGLLSFLMLIPGEASAMSMLYLFSQVRGVVVNHGKPVSGAVVERSYHWHWKDTKGKDEATTNDKGEFSLPEITGRAMMAWLPHEAIIDQEITIQHAGKSYRAWVYDKRNYDRNGELAGKPIVLHCELASEPKRTPTGQFGSSVFGICELR